MIKIKKTNSQILQLLITYQYLNQNLVNLTILIDNQREYNISYANNILSSGNCHNRRWYGYNISRTCEDKNIFWEHHLKTETTEANPLVEICKWHFQPLPQQGNVLLDNMRSCMYCWTMQTKNILKYNSI